MPKTEIPFAGGAYNMPATQLDAQTCVNWYTVVDKTGKYKLSLFPRAGLSLFVTDTNQATTRGNFSLNNVHYEVIDNKFYAVYDDQTREELGTLNTSTGYVKIIQNDYQLSLHDGQYGYVYQVVETDIYDQGEFFQITNASSTIGTPHFIGVGIDDLTASGRYRGDISTTYKIEIDGSDSTIQTPVFTGTGLDDLTASGFYTGGSTITFTVKIDGTGATDTFKWSTDGGSTWVATTVSITGLVQTLQNGFKIKFNAITGHTLDDQWDIEVIVTPGVPNTFKWSDDNGSTWKGTQVDITGASQKLSNGVFVQFNSIEGHTLGDIWTIAVDVESAFYPPIYPAAQDGYGLYPQQDTNRVYITAVNDFNTIDPLDYQEANVYQDKNVGAISVNQEVYIIKQVTTEVWNNVGATSETNFPFQRRSNFVINYGCEAAFTIKACSTNVILFLGRNKDSSRVVVKIENYNASVVSTEPLNREFLSYERVDDAFADIIEINNHIFCYFTFPTAGKTWAYDLSTDMWNEWSSLYPTSFPDITGYTRGRFRGMFHSILNGKHLIGDSVSGKIFEFSQTAYLDYDTPIERERTAPHFSTDNKWISINSLFIDMESGVAKQTGQGSEPTLMLQVSRDGGKTWGSELWRTSGNAGEYSHRALWDSLGTARQFTFRLRCTDPVYNVILGVVADLEAFD